MRCTRPRHGPVDRRHERVGRGASSRSNTFTGQISASGAFSRITAATAVPCPSRSTASSPRAPSASNADAARHRPDVRMRRVHAAVDDGHATPPPGRARRSRRADSTPGPNHGPADRHHAARASTAPAKSRAKAPPGARQRSRSAGFDQPRALDHRHAVGGHRHGGAMRDDDRRPAAHHGLVAFDDLPLLTTGSSAAVGSSSTSTDGLARNARAMATRCRSPADNCCPRSPTIVPDRCGRPLEKVASAGGVGRAHARVVVGVRTRVADVLGHVACSSVGSCSTSTTWRRTIAQAERRAGRGRRAHHACIGIEQPQHQIGQRRFAAAARPDDRHRRARRHPQAEASSTASAALGRERDASNSTTPRTAGRPCASGALTHLDRRVEQLQHPPPRHLGGGQRRVQPHQRLHRRVHAHLVRDERRERAERERAVDHPRAAVEEHRGGAERNDERRAGRRPDR